MKAAKSNRTAPPVWTKQEVDALTKTHTAYDNFEALLCATGYRPTINVFSAGAKRLADCYDAAQASRKDTRKVHRYTLDIDSLRAVRMAAAPHNSISEGSAA